MKSRALHLAFYLGNCTISKDTRAAVLKELPRFSMFFGIMDEGHTQVQAKHTVLHSKRHAVHMAFAVGGCNRRSIAKKLPFPAW